MMNHYFLLCLLFNVIFQCTRSAQQTYVVNDRELQQGKSVLSTPYSSLNQIELGDNEVVMLSLPWGGFPFFNGVYKSAYLSSNGILSFADDASMSTSTLRKPFPHKKIAGSRNADQKIFIVVLHRHLAASHMYDISALARRRHSDRGDPDFQLHIHQELPNLRMIAISDPSHSALDYLRRHPHVLSVEADEEITLTASEDMGIHTLHDHAISSANRRLDSAPYAWGLDRCDQEQLPLDEASYSPGGLTRAGRGVDVYVLDSGLMTSHVEFQSPDGYDRVVKNVWDGYIPDATNPDVDNDINGHGSHVAGTVGGSNVGIAPGANLFGVKVLFDDLRGQGSIIVAGIEFVIEQRKRNASQPMLVQMSLGSNCGTNCASRPLTIGTSELRKYEIHTVASAMNAEQDACQFTPALVPTVVAVGATNISDHIAFFSNYGECVKVLAPGVDIVSVSTASWQGNDGYAVRDGTSQAAPHASGVLALWLSKLAWNYTVLPASVAETTTAMQCTSAYTMINLDGKETTPNLLTQIPPDVSSFYDAYATCGLLAIDCPLGGNGLQCSGRGICFAGDTCRCDTYWGGETCEEYLNNCYFDCGLHGSCVFMNCDCDDNWFGEECNLQCEDSVGGVCSGHGTCVNGACECNTAWTGDMCNTTCAVINGSMCSGKGQCIAGECQCDELYTGTLCDTYDTNYLTNSYCCDGLHLWDWNVDPFLAIAMFWTDLDPSDPASGRVYSGLMNDTVYAVVFDNIALAGSSCAVTFELLLHSKGHIELAIIENSIGTLSGCAGYNYLYSYPAAYYAWVTIGIKGAYGNGVLEYDERVGVQWYGLPESAHYEYMRIDSLPSVEPTAAPTNPSAPPTAPPSTDENDVGRNANNDKSDPINMNVIVVIAVVGFLVLVATISGIVYYWCFKGAGTRPHQEVPMTDISVA